MSYYLKRYCSLTSNVHLGKKGYLNTMHFDEWPFKWPCPFCAISLQSVQGNILNLEAAAQWNHAFRSKGFIHLMALPFPNQYLIFLCLKDSANTYVFIVGVFLGFFQCQKKPTIKSVLKASEQNYFKIRIFPWPESI